VLNGALFVGSSNTLSRIRAVPVLPKAEDPRLEQLLETRMEFRGCFGRLGEIADYIMYASGVPVIVDLRIRDRLATQETPFVQNITCRDFIWWMCVLNNDAVPTIWGKTIRIEPRQNLEPEAHSTEGDVSNRPTVHRPGNTP